MMCKFQWMGVFTHRNVTLRAAPTAALPDAVSDQTCHDAIGVRSGKVD